MTLRAGEQCVRRQKDLTGMDWWVDPLPVLW